MDIIVKDADGSEIASGTLVVDTSVSPNTATLTPEDGTATACTGVVWTSNPNGAVGFTFQVSGQANGDFPLGANGNAFTYRFTGVQNANGLPNGNVNWPAHPGITADDNATWQGEATEDEPFARTQGAT